MKIRRRIPSGTSSRSNSKKKSTPNIIIPLIVSLIVVLSGVFYIKYIINNIVTNNGLHTSTTGFNNNNINGTKYFIGDSFNDSGTIQLSTELGSYLATFTNYNGIQYGLKSSELDLSLYSGDVVISGEIADIMTNITIINVTDILQIEKELVVDDLTGSMEELGNDLNDHYYPEFGLSIKFGSYTGYIVDKIGDKINIYKNSSDNQPSELAASISPFSCVSGSSTLDCAQLKSKFDKGGMSNFTTSNGIKFYTFVESNNSLFFNKNLFGFNISPSNSSYTSIIAPFIYLDDFSDIKSYINSNINDLCSSESRNLDKGVIEFRIDKGLLYSTIQGKNSSSNSYVCELLIGSPNNPKYSLISLKVDEDSNTNNSNDSINTVNNNNNDVQSYIIDELSNSEINTGNYLQFSSTQGFNLLLPKYVSYEANFIETTEDLGYPNLKCNYKINVVNYKNKDQLSSNPSLTIYYCKNQGGDINTSGRPIRQIKLDDGLLVFLHKDDQGSIISKEIKIY